MTAVTDSAKLDAILAKVENMEVFQPDEVAAMRRMREFSAAFHDDPSTLKRMQEVFTAVEGWIKISRTALIVLGVVVVALTQWDRLKEFIGIVGPKP